MDFSEARRIVGELENIKANEREWRTKLFVGLDDLRKVLDKMELEYLRKEQKE